jgi:cyclopropane fatty-acyl-phospholipid synthase-like methyltransferase
MNKSKTELYGEVRSFYDGEWSSIEERKLSGVNSRHRHILNNLKKAGLKKNSTVLEIGCGNGTLTNFIAEQIPQGKIVAADISEETIKLAKKKFLDKKSNIEFLVSDMTAFRYSMKFDFVVFPDVLEHIPAEDHDNIIANIKENTNDSSVILVNIPNPTALEFLEIHHKELLQIIDQPLHTDKLIAPFYKYGFRLESMKTYSVFYEEADYQSLVFKKNIPFSKMIVRTKSKVIFNNLLLRMTNLFR